MAKYYYNDVLLPEIPDDGFQYHVITRSSSGYYYLFSLPSRCYHIGGKLYDPDTGSKINRQAYTIAPSEVENATIWNPDGSAVSAEVYVSNIVMTTVWADYDIPNGSADATEIYFHGSDPVPESGGEPTTDTLYTVNGFSLTAVANAIRGKTGTIGELAFPDGYVSAVNDISSVSDLSNAKDIAFGGNESGGKYVIEDETITPLFDQIQRITETEDSMTFEGATESLLNIVPGGGLPNAEDGSFGDDESAMELGVSSIGTPTNYSTSSVYYAFNKFTANEAINIVGLRYLSVKQTGSTKLRLWNANGEMVKETESVTPTLNEWVTAYFDTPVSIAINEEFYVSTESMRYVTYIDNGTTFNGKISFNWGTNASSNAVPTSGRTTRFIGLVDIIISTTAAELPDEYQIARSTMDDIANEVKRITGTTGKMSTAQMLTALQAITTE